MKFSRHARNNMRLYGIAESDIELAVSAPDGIEKAGGNFMLMKLMRGRFSGYPLKVVFRKENGEIFIITAYPLKKGFRGKQP